MLDQGLMMAELTSRGLDFLTVMIRQTAEGPQVLILMADQEGEHVNDQIIEGEDVESVRRFFARVVEMIDLSTSRQGGVTLN